MICKIIISGYILCRKYLINILIFKYTKFLHFYLCLVVILTLKPPYGCARIALVGSIDDPDEFCIVISFSSPKHFKHVGLSEQFSLCCTFVMLNFYISLNSQFEKDIHLHGQKLIVSLKVFVNILCSLFICSCFSRSSCCFLFC